MGLFDLFRSKPDEDPILGNRGQQPTGLEVTPVEATAEQGGGMDPGELVRQLQAAGGNPDELVGRLRQMFPDAQISVSESSVDASSNPDAAAQVLSSFGFAGAPSADPIAQLERLAALRDSGALTDAEFAAAKAKLLG
jgi:hypothetical protein